VQNEHVTDSGTPPRADTHPFVSPSLFVDITTITVDPGYVAAAARRAADPSARPPRATTALALTALLAVGGVWGVAAAQTRDRAPAAARIRASLVEEAERRTSATDRLAAEQARLRHETTAAREAALRQSAAGRALSDELARLELAAAGARVRGPGLVVTLDDAEMAGEDADDRITDADLQNVVNALWAAGAEAVTVNDRRIGSLTAIREAGEAILVDYRPVSPPYVVRAVGDPDDLEPAFVDSPTGRRFETYVEAFGLRFDVDRADRLDLPGSETSRLRHATPAGTKGAP
jgi:uncharacterized protein YlxW (UPF0749 family)